MKMTISNIYTQYSTPKNLQQHMLRVASLASLITENWTTPHLSKNDILVTCLLHDIAKPMTFDLAKQAQFGMSAQDIEKLAKLQKTLRQTYGDNEHIATYKICQEIGVNENILRLIDNLEWSNIPLLLEKNDIESLIPIYCDMRIGPEALLSIEVRVADVTKREESNKTDEFTKNGIELEKTIQSHCKYDLKSITNEKIENKTGQMAEYFIG
jgi:hypothetical protein